MEEAFRTLATAYGVRLLATAFCLALAVLIRLSLQSASKLAHSIRCREVLEPLLQLALTGDGYQQRKIDYEDDDEDEDD